MSDEDTYVPMHPAIPSRATGEMRPINDQSPLPREPARRAPRAPRAASRKVAPKRAAVRPARKARKAAPKRAAKRSAPLPAAPKNPNRPLEARNTLNAVLAYAGSGVPAAELAIFTEITSLAQKLTKPARKRVINALQQMYG